jgi:hypothetical protein
MYRHSAHTVRLACVALTLCIIAAGLLWRSRGLALSPTVAKYGGSALWGAMVFAAMLVVLPRARTWAVALLAAVFAALVEFSQLLHWPWLDDFRSTRFGALLLGRVFDWWDILFYWIGIAAIAAADRLFGEARRRE